MGVIIPTPTVFVSEHRLQAIRQAVRAAPDRATFPWRPLPPVDPNAIARKKAVSDSKEAAARRQAAAAAQDAKGPIRSAFSRSGGDGGGFTSRTGVFGAKRAEEAPKPAAGGVLGAGQVSGGRRRRSEEETEKEEKEKPPAPRNEEDFLKRLRTDWRR